MKINADLYTVCLDFKFENKAEYEDFKQKCTENITESNFDRYDNLYHIRIDSENVIATFIKVISEVQNDLFRVSYGGKDKQIFAINEYNNACISAHSRIGNDFELTYCDKMRFHLNQTVEFFIGNKLVNQCSWEDFGLANIKIFV